MTLVKISAGASSYEVLIGPNSLGEAGAALGRIFGRAAGALICDRNVAPLFAETLQENLQAAGIRITRITVPPGENAKNLEQAGLICDEMIRAGLDRHSFVIGLGGGVIGDLSGFVAAIYQRGIPHVQIPTTLLAMVDSSIGGKTGVNTASGKNLLGAVHHPALVIADTALLSSLPEREFKQGFAEMIKHGIIADAEMFRMLKNFEPGQLPALVQRNVEIKASFVKGDELDRTGRRALLNFGHTVGHAIEKAGGYREFRHGEAVSLGMAAASVISVARAGLAPDQRNEILELLRRFDLPTKLPKSFPREPIFEALRLDKKFEQGQIRFVVTPKIGSAYLSSDVTMSDISAAVEALG